MSDLDTVPPQNPSAPYKSTSICYKMKQYNYLFAIPPIRKSFFFAECDGWYGHEGLVHRGRGSGPARGAVSALPPGARRRHQLGRHGEGVAPHLLQ